MRDTFKSNEAGFAMNAIGSDPFIERIKLLLQDTFEKTADVAIEEACVDLRKRLEVEKGKASAKFIQAIDVFTERDIVSDKYIVHITIQK